MTWQKDAQKRRFLENNQHSLLRHMPIDYQKLFFFGRHNLGNLFEQLEKLAFMGLITFENVASKWTKPKDENPQNLSSSRFPVNNMSKELGFTFLSFLFFNFAYFFLQSTWIYFPFIP